MIPKLFTFSGMAPPNIRCDVTADKEKTRMKTEKTTNVWN